MKERGEEDIIDLPGWLSKMKGDILEIPLQNGESIRLFNIENKAILSKSTKKIILRMKISDEEGRSHLLLAKTDQMSDYLGLETKFNMNLKMVLRTLLSKDLFKLADDGSSRTQ